MRFVELLANKDKDYHNHPAPSVVFLGDSVTHGCFEIHRGKNHPIEVVCDFDAVYHNQFKKMLNVLFPYSPINVINAGISGDSAEGGLARLERDVLNYTPNLVVVCYGLNDSNGGSEKIKDYKEALYEIFSTFKKQDIEAIFMTPNMKNTYISPLLDPFFVDIAKREMESQISGMFNKYLDEARLVCKDLNIPVCDCYNKWKKLYEKGVDTTLLLSNYINHPTRKMHKLFAMSLIELIMEI